MYRTVFKQLIEWKANPNRKPLILNGARQVGKTWLLRELAQKEYKKEAYINCRKNEAARHIFTQDFDIERILRSLRALTHIDITPGDTLIILDEIQDIPEALEALKYFCEQAPHYHVAVAGPLLGISLHQGVSFPIGKVSEIAVYPMTFQEFLLAIGEEQTCHLIDNNDFDALLPLHQHCIDLLRQYYFVGGMPEAVKEYASTGALNAVRTIQQAIVNGYDRDFPKHAPTDQVPRIRQVWQSIPSQLFKENKKFIYGALRQGARAAEYELAIRWLIDAGMVYRVPNCSRPELPLAVYEDLHSFKLYLLDVGLLGAMLSLQPEVILIGDKALSQFNGGLTELFVLTQMKAHGTQPIYYHKDDRSRLEIDFLIQDHAQIIPIEVKAGGNVRANSLSHLLAQTPSLHALRYSLLPYRQQQQLTNLPLYAAR